MKTTLIIMLLLLCSSCAQYRAINHNIGESGYDWTIHYPVGAVAGGLAVHYSPDNWEPWQKFLFGVGSSLAVGIAIESLDKHFDSHDVMEYGFGGAIGSGMLSFEF